MHRVRRCDRLAADRPLLRSRARRVGRTSHQEAKMANPVVHFEVMGGDGPALQSFYRDVFGWKVDANNPMNYGIVDNGGEGINGGISGSPDGTSHATFYVQVDDPQAALDQIEKLGGQ